MQKIAVVLMSDPHAGEEATGRMFNALFLVEELKGRSVEVKLLFQATGTRWIKELVNPVHPAHALYRRVEDKLGGVSLGCATVFGAVEGVKLAGVSLTADHDIAGIGAVQDLSRYVAEGYSLITF